jgi:hypothetical protein
MLTILQIAFRLTAHHWKMTLFIFIINLVFALVIAQPFYTTLGEQTANSMEMDKLVTGFDFTTFSDFLRVSGKKLAFLFPLIIILGIIYFILNLFFSGGIIDKFGKPNEAFNISQFINASKRYFLRFLGLFLFQILLSVLVLLIGGVLFLIAGNIAEGGTERTYFYAFLIPFLIFLGLITIVWLIGDYAKIIVYREGCSIWKAFKAAIGYVFKNPKTIWLYWLLIAVFLVIGLIYLLMDATIGMTSIFTIGLMFVLQQTFVFIRVFIRNWQIGTTSEFYSLRPILDLRQIEIPNVQETETPDTERINSQENITDV